jgi:superfamily II DNA or RNA helicase
MRIIVGDIFSTLENPRDNMDALKIIRQVCRARPNGYQFMPRFRNHQWDGYISLMHSPISFPTGFVNMIDKALQDQGYEVDYEAYPWLDTHWVNVQVELDGITLRDYQLDAARNMLAHYRGIAKMATNSGKTEVMAAIIKMLGCPKTFVFLHRKELLYQTAERFEKRLGIKVGKIGDGIFEPENVTVSMIQTAANRAVMPYEFTQLVMVDECHTASSDSYLDVLSKVPGKYRYGFSGTPLKHDVLADMKLIGMTGDVVVEVTNKELIDQEYSAKPVVHIIKRGKRGDDWGNPYRDAHSTYIENNDERNNKIAELASSQTGTVLVIVNRIKHGKTLEALIPGAHFVCGSDTTEVRLDTLDAMRDGGGIFIASPIFDEGVDVPALDCIILADPGKSYVKLLQRIGRGLRRKEGHNVLTVYDFLDNDNKHLHSQSKRRMAIYEEEQFDIQRI